MQNVPQSASGGQGRGHGRGQSSLKSSAGRGRGRGRNGFGKSKINWSGQGERNLYATKEKHENFISRIPRTDNIPAKPTLDLKMTTEEDKCFSDLLELIKNKTSQPRTVLFPHFSSSKNPILSCLTLCSNCRHPSEGKQRSVLAIILQEFDSWKKKNPQDDSHSKFSEKHKDFCFYFFSNHGNIDVARNAFRIFQLQADRYENVINHFCANYEFKRACVSVIALGLHTRRSYSISWFCIPLLIQGKHDTLEAYLRISLTSAKSLVLFLDSLIGNPSHLHPYANLAKPAALSQLSGKPLDRLIKKYSSMFNVEAIELPCYFNKVKTQDLIYWIGEIRNTDSESLVSWRELMEVKLESSPHLHQVFLNRLARYDQEEARHWSRKLNCMTKETSFLFEDTEIESLEESWDEHTFTSDLSALKITEVDEHEEGRNSYFVLPLKREQVIFVETLAALKQCLGELSKETILGVDGEFTAGPYVKKMSIFQISSLNKAYILDMNALSHKLKKDDDWKPLENLFANENIYILGFGITEDLKLLSNTVPGLSHLWKRSTQVICLEKMRKGLADLLQLTATTEKGLSGFTEMVLGSRLNKSNQISNWDRRPLRESQLTYAALDAYVCVAIFQRLHETAAAQGKTAEFDKILKNRNCKQPEAKKNAKTDGGKKLEPIHKEPITPSELSVVCDTMLQGLCKKLRVCGVNAVALENGQDHNECLKLRKAQSEKFCPVYVISSGTPALRLAKQLKPGFCLSLQETSLDAQLAEVFRYFNVVAKDGDLFSRCVICNCNKYLKVSDKLLMRILESESSGKPAPPCVPAGYESDSEDSEFAFPDKSFNEELKYEDSVSDWEEVEGGKVDPRTGITGSGVKINALAVPRPVIESNKEFWICGSCGKIYWQGSHWNKAQNRVKSFLNVAPTPNPSPQDDTEKN